MKPKSIFLVSPGWPKDIEDDRCLPACHVFVGALRNERPDLRLRALALHYPYRRGERHWGDVPVFDIGGANSSWPLRIAALMRAYRTLQTAHRSEAIDVIHCFLMTDAALVASVFARLNKIPVIVTLLGQDALSSNRYARWVSARHRVVAPSERAASEFQRNFRRVKPRVIPWGCEVPRASAAERTIDLLGVGSLSEGKDFATFVRIAAWLRDMGLMKRAVICGDGPQRAALRMQLKEASLEDTIDLTGAIPRAQVLRTMERSKVLLHPSLWEGFGFVFAEALSRGTKIVSRPVGIAEESPDWRVCADEGGLLEACAQFLNARATPGGTAYKRFDVRETVANYADLYEGLAAQ